MYGTLVSQLVMRNLISLAFDSAEGLAWSSIKNVFLIVSTRQHMHMNAAQHIIGPEMYVPWRRSKQTFGQRRMDPSID